MARIVLNLTQDENVGLVDLATREMRDPHEQLRFILRVELERRGLLPSVKVLAPVNADATTQTGAMQNAI